MPRYCVAMHCSNYQISADHHGSGFTMHKFPKDPARRMLWVAAVRRKAVRGVSWCPSATSNLCSTHFAEEAFDRTGQTVRLRQDAVPTIFNFVFPHNQQQDLPSRKSPVSRAPLPSRAPQPVATENCRPTSQLEQSHQEKELVKVEKDALPEHNYHCSTSPQDLRAALVESRSREEIYRSKLQLARSEQRELQGQAALLKKQVSFQQGQVSLLLTQLEEARGLQEEAASLLQSYAALPVELIERHPEGYSASQWQFATTLHSYGPKSYEYLRQTGFSLPESGAFLSCKPETKMEISPEDTDTPGYTDTEKTIKEEPLS